MKKHSVLGIGSVSSGTMRAEDLIPSFLWECEFLRMSKDDRDRIRQIDRYSEKEGYYQSEDSMYDLEDLFDILGNYVPPFCYFGSCPGDGADYGVWICDDSIRDAIKDGEAIQIADLSELPRGYTGTAFIGNDHGNLSCYTVTNGRTREAWSIV